MTASPRDAPLPAATVDDFVTRALEHRGTPPRRVRRRPSSYGSTHALEVVDADLDDGSTIRLIFKDLSPRSVLEPAVGVKPERLVNPRREIDVYEHILDKVDVGTATVFGSVGDDEGSRYWLLIEHVDAPPLWQVGDFGVWQAAARWLARMHDEAGKIVEFATASLLRYDAAELGAWSARAVAAAREEDAGTLRGIVRRYAAVVELLTHGPARFVHGELYASNVLANGGRICVVDWEMAGTGSPALDLAALVAGWDDERRAALVRCYHAAAADPPPLPTFERSVEAARLHNALRWLGWSATWQPPREHRTDWLREASEAAERLG